MEDLRTLIDIATGNGTDADRKRACVMLYWRGVREALEEGPDMGREFRHRKDAEMGIRPVVNP